MKISFFKKIYLWFIRFMDKLTKEEMVHVQKRVAEKKATLKEM